MKPAETGPSGRGADARWCGWFIADHSTWQYVWSDEEMRRELEARTEDFHDLVLSRPEIDADAITRRQLVSLYAEFVELHEVRPMPWARFNRSLKGAGFERYRSSAAGRPWLYRAIRPGSALIFKAPPPQRVRAIVKAAA